MSVEYSEMNEDDLIQHIKDGIGPASTAAAEAELNRRWLRQLGHSISVLDNTATDITEAVEKLHKTIATYNKSSERSTRWMIILTVVIGLVTLGQLIIAISPL